MADAVVRFGFIAAAFTAVLSLVCCLPLGDGQPEAAVRQGARRPSSRDARWATPIQKPGLPNLHKVSEALYRGAQPDDEGWAELKQMGIRTVVNLRSFHSSRSEAAAAGLGYDSLYVKAWHPEDKEIVAFLGIVTDPERTPVFVHCQHGADRTGTLCAIYRMAVQGWTAEEAIEEMTKGGFGFHGVWSNLLDYVRGLDLDDLKRRAGLTAEPRQDG
jgi:protein tyrosine/serine phosphatase